CSRHVADPASDGPDQGAGVAQIALLVRVQDGDEGDLGQVQAFPQQVDSHQDVEGAQPQVTQDLHPLQRVDVEVQVVDLHPHLSQVVGQVLGHLLGQDS